MRLFQLTSNITGEPIGLYLCEKSVAIIEDEEVMETLTQYHEFCNDNKHDEGDALLESKGVKRVFVDQTVYVD